MTACFSAFNWLISSVRGAIARQVARFHVRPRGSQATFISLRSRRSASCSIIWALKPMGFQSNPRRDGVKARGALGQRGFVFPGALAQGGWAPPGNPARRARPP